MTWDGAFLMTAATDITLAQALARVTRTEKAMGSLMGLAAGTVVALGAVQVLEHELDACVDAMEQER